MISVNGSSWESEPFLNIYIKYILWDFEKNQNKDINIYSEILYSISDI